MRFKFLISSIDVLRGNNLENIEYKLFRMKYIFFSYNTTPVSYYFNVGRAKSHENIRARLKPNKLHRMEINLFLAMICDIFSSLYHIHRIVIYIYHTLKRN